MAVLLAAKPVLADPETGDELYGVWRQTRDGVPRWLAIPTEAELARASAPVPLSLNTSVVYTLHFVPPYTPYVDAPRYKCAGHYTGWARNLQARLAQHAAGTGAKLTKAQVEAGGTWRVATVEPGTRFRERQLKARGASRRCPVCKAEAKIEKQAQAEAAGAEAGDRERGAVLLTRQQSRDLQPDPPAGPAPDAEAEAEFWSGIDAMPRPGSGLEPGLEPDLEPEPELAI